MNKIIAFIDSVIAAINNISNGNSTVADILFAIFTIILIIVLFLIIRILVRFISWLFKWGTKKEGDSHDW